MRTLKLKLALAILFGCVLSGAALAENPTPFAGTFVVNTAHSYERLVEKLTAAIAKHKMGVVARASATNGAKNLGINIAGNQVVMVFHPKFAVRMLKASVAAGIEAPLRYYVTENADGTATLTYRAPSSIFSPYDSDELNAMAVELDAIFASIAADAVAL